MRRTLTPKTNLDTLRKDAKRWLKAIRAGDETAIARLRDASAKFSADPGLRDVHQALALEYGCENWVALKAAIASFRALLRAATSAALVRRHVSSCTA